MIIQVESDNQFHNLRRRSVGFFVTYDEKRRRAAYPMLHDSKCPRIQSESGRNYTSNEYRKVFSTDLAEVKNWARLNDNRELKFCKTCFMQDRISIAATSRSVTNTASGDEFEVGRLYSRRRDIHEKFGGQRRGGISTPNGAGFIALFTGESGNQYGYKDGWNDDGVYTYTGEGQVGDMQFVRGNKAIRDHLLNSKELLLFEQLGKRKPCRYIGTFVCAGWESRSAPDKHNNLREVIVFHLLTKDDSNIKSVHNTDQFSKLPFDRLRQLAYNASDTPKEKGTRQTRSRYYDRSETVKAYVLARADGQCEACRNRAPFIRLDGTPYLEPHHIRRVSDGGPDHPEWVGGICPNCHREIHCGQNGRQLNEQLRKFVLESERTLNNGKGKRKGPIQFEDQGSPLNEH